MAVTFSLREEMKIEVKSGQGVEVRVEVGSISVHYIGWGFDSPRCGELNVSPYSHRLDGFVR